MSRIGRKVITIPAGVTVSVNEENLVTVKGPKGTLATNIHKNITVSVEGANVAVARLDDERENRSLHGLSRTLIANMVEGVTKGYSKTLEMIGVGYKAAKSGKTLTLNLGHSHPIIFEEKDGITFEVPNSTTIVVNGIDKQLVGQIAAQIREKRPPEPYLGKGVKYVGEHIRRKAGKTGK
ncbi:MAG: 50S ribosomal protein L6 [Ruminococcaceae bacterium]|nr:50S ribosomal protein L6 [Oscillospiraceae bacterium]